MFMFGGMVAVEVLAYNLYIIRTPLSNTLVYVFGDDPNTGDPIYHGMSLN